MTERPAMPARPELCSQHWRFAVVGCLNVAISGVVFLLLYEIWPVATLFLNASGSTGAWIRGTLAEHGIEALDAAAANSLGYVAGMANSFALNKTWTFRAHGNVLRQIHRFVTLNLLGLLLSTLLLFVFVDLLDGPHLIVWTGATAVVMVINFYGNRSWTFARTRPREATPSAGGEAAATIRTLPSTRNDHALRSGAANENPRR